jgi:hypothetical protein
VPFDATAVSSAWLVTSVAFGLPIVPKEKMRNYER